MEGGDKTRTGRMEGGHAEAEAADAAEMQRLSTISAAWVEAQREGNLVETLLEHAMVG